MRPNSVASPVANTTALPVPAVTEVPMNTPSRASAAAVPAFAGSAVRPDGWLSPVSAAISTDSACASITRASADTASPASSTMTSPGTRSSAPISASSPPRSTRAACGTIACSASAVRSAMCSCTNPISAFSTTTPRIPNARYRFAGSRGEDRK